MPQVYLVVHQDGRFERIERQGPILDNDLEQIVGGPPEHVVLTRDMCAYCHETGRLEGLPSNAAFPNMAGTIVLCREDPDGLYCGFGFTSEELEALESGERPGPATVYMSPVQTIFDFRPVVYSVDLK